MSKKTTFQIGDFAVVIDSADLPRVQARRWTVTGTNGSLPVFASIEGGEPQLLAGFILGAKPVTFCEQKDSRGASALDFRKRNLRVSPRAGVR